MDRLNQLRSEAGGSGDSTLDTTSPPSEAYMSANESSSKYFSLSDSTFDMTPIKDVSLASTSAVSSAADGDPDELMSNLSPIGKKELDTYKIGKHIEAANILSGGVNIFDDNENSFDGDELVIDDNVDLDKKSDPEKAELAVDDSTLVEDVASKDMEVVLQIDGKNVNAIDIGNGLYLYRKDGQEELAAVQIIDGDQPQPSFKFLKVRENAEGNLEVYEEIEIEVPKEVPAKEGKLVNEKTPHVPIQEISKVTSDHSSTSKITDKKYMSPQKETVKPASSENKDEEKDTPEVNFNGKMAKISESRKSPVVGSFTSMIPFHSTPNKEGKPLTKTMVDLQLDPNRHTDIAKKTIEVHTDTVKQKSPDSIITEKDIVDSPKSDVNIIADDKVTKTGIKSETETFDAEEKGEQKKASIISSEKVKSDESLENQSSKTQESEQKVSETKNNTGDNLTVENDITDKLIVKDIIVDNKNNKMRNVDSADAITEDFSQTVNEICEAKSNIKNEIKDHKQTDDACSSSVVEAAMSSTSKVQPDEEAKKISSSIVTTTSHHVPVLESSETEPDFIKTVEVLENPSSNLEITPDELEDKPVTGKLSDQESKVESSDAKPDSIKLTEVADHAYTISNVTSTNVENEMLASKPLDQISEVESTKIEPNSLKQTEETDLQTCKPSEESQTLKSDQVTEVQSSTVNADSTNQTSTSEHAYSVLNPNENNKNPPKTSNLFNLVPKVESSVSKPDSNKLTPTSTLESAVITPNIASFEMKNKLPTSMSSSDRVVKVESSEEKPDSNKVIEPECVLSSSKITFQDVENKPKIPSESSHQVLKSESLISKSDSVKISSVSVSSATRLPKMELTFTKHELISKISDSKSTENIKSAIPTLKTKCIDKSNPDETVPKAKPSESSKSGISVPNIKSSEIISFDASALKVKSACMPTAITSSLPTSEVKVSVGQANSLKKVQNLEIGSEIIPVAKQTGQTVPPIVKFTEPRKQGIPVPKHKATVMAQNTISKLKADTVIKAESKSSIVPPKSSDNAIKISSAVIVSGPKHILVETAGLQRPKIGETKNINDKANNPSETLTRPTQSKSDSKDIKDAAKKPPTEQKPVNNNHTAAVPFGKWTEVNRQEFLNKFKEVKVPVSTNTKQIKNSNDLNRRDVLKKIDSQRQQTIINNATSKVQEKQGINNEAVFSSKLSANKKDTKIHVKNESAEINKNISKQEHSQKAVPIKQDHLDKSMVESSVVTMTVIDQSAPKVDPLPRIDVSTATISSLIDRTIEGMITRVVPTKNIDEINKSETTSKSSTTKDAVDPGTLDDIEMKMNELHGIPFVERPPHELPKVPISEIKTYSKSDKTKPHDKSTGVLGINQKPVNQNVIEVDSDEEVIEHEPVTGDINLNKKSTAHKNSEQEKSQPVIKSHNILLDNKNSKNESIITENEFDKFARRNSVTYENCLTVNIDNKDSHKVVKVAKEKDFNLKIEKEAVTKTYSKNEAIRIEPKPHKQPFRQNIHATKTQCANSKTLPEEPIIKNNQSKIHSAYQSALTAKRHVNPPITILEDKPVKVMFLDCNTGFVPSQLNVQGQELSPPKILDPALDVAANSSTNSVDSDILDAYEHKQQDKVKIKHQRKQVLTPVEAPELELIQPSVIPGVEGLPKKKRKIDEHKADKQSKNVVHKKSYLLGRNTTADIKNGINMNEPKDGTHALKENLIEHKSTASAIDSLVKAAELLENQPDTLNQNLLPQNTDNNQQNTPVKRGRGRPRKYPLPEGMEDKKQPSPQKKPKLTDAKPISDENDDEDTDDEIVRENWTMGKINENIVCPICNKLFRSENVVFKHVKHCTGVSPNRSESDKSFRRGRSSQDFDDMEYDYDESLQDNKKKKRKSKESVDTETKSSTKSPQENEDVIIINDTPVKDKPEKHDKEKDNEPSKIIKQKIPRRSSNISCEICGKSFRQLSYLVNHKLQHKRERIKKTEIDTRDLQKSEVFSCEVCKKEFRKLHHLVQHRIIHETDSSTTRALRKSSSEQNDAKKLKDETASKQNEDQSAAFRCEPCDKSFRKLHHLVEHRETHDGINRQKMAVSAQSPVEKPDPPPQCEICKKTFRKLHHLIEHKEQHIDTSSDRSDDKSVKSSLSTKDIIHECSLCYMVFPNEHSLNKHSSLCAKKKRQSKQLKNNLEKSEEVQKDIVEESRVEVTFEEIINDSNQQTVKEPGEKHDNPIIVEEVAEIVNKGGIPDLKQVQEQIEEKTPEPHQAKASVPPTICSKQSLELDNDKDKTIEKSVVSEKNTKFDQKENTIEEVKETPKKKTPQKIKVVPFVSKRHKSTEVTLESEHEQEQPKTSLESSDEDDVRYMLNPNYKNDDISEGKKFMKIRSSKRNSLQIERTIAKEFVKRRTSLQHPPKVPRLKAKAGETKVKINNHKVRETDLKKDVEPKAKMVEPKIKIPETKSKISEPKTKLTVKSLRVPSQTEKSHKEVEAILSTDSDDSDVRYSFPKPSKITKLAQERNSKDEKKERKNTPKKSLTEKMKAIGGVAKRKSMEKVVTKPKIKSSPIKTIKKRRGEVELRCDCGQQFGSAALLARHASAAHTPPRIRRRRDLPPPPAPAPAPPHKPDIKSVAAKTTRRSAALTAVPVPEKVRKVQKTK